MKKRMKKFLKDNAIVIVVIVDILMLLALFYMFFGWVVEIGMFHAAMNAIAG